MACLAPGAAPRTLSVECAVVWTDPESVLILHPGPWCSLITGLWPVFWLLFVWNAPLHGRMSVQLARPAGRLAARLRWRGGRFRRYSGRRASWSSTLTLWDTLLSFFFFSSSLHSGKMFSGWSLLAPLRSTASCEDPSGPVRTPAGPVRTRLDPGKVPDSK